MIADNNTISQTRYGIWLFGYGQTTPNSVMPTYFHLYVNNSFQYNQRAIYNTICRYPSIDAGPGMLGNIYRGNTTVSPLLNDISHTFSYVTSGTAQLDMTIYEHNTGTNVPLGADISADTGGGNYIFYRNSTALGTGTYAGSMGIKFAAGQKPALIENAWSGFATTYAGTPPGAVLEIPYRYIAVTGSAYGISVNDSIYLWNAGTSTLNWSATSDASWLTLSSSTGAITNEDGDGNVTITCNPSSLNVGTYTGTIAVTCAGQTQKATVRFTVLNPTPSPSGLQLWVKADAGVTVDGSNNVTQWSDQSGNGNHLAPSGSTRSPRYVNSGINGLPTIEFYRYCNNLRKILDTPLPGSFQIFVVCSSPTGQAYPDTWGPNARVISCPTTTSEDYQEGMVMYPGTGYAFSPTLKQYTKTLTSGQNLKTFGLGTQMGFNGGVGSFYYFGYMSEVLIYNRLLTTQENSDVVTYLRNKYNLP